MRTLIAAVLLWSLPANPSLARIDWDGHMYLSGAPDRYQRAVVVEPFTPTPVYLLLEDEFPAGLSAWEASIVSTHAEVAIVNVVLHPPGVAINVSLEPDAWVVGTSCLLDGPGIMLIATFEVVATVPIQNAVLSLGAVDPPLSTFSPGRGGDGIYTPGWVGCADVDDTIHHATVEDADADTPGTANGYILINESPVATQPSSWGAVKALFN